MSRGRTAARASEAPPPELGDFRARHLVLGRRRLLTECGAAEVTVNEAESPLVWLAKRRGRDGRPMIEPHQFQAGERLRADFTRANLMPRTSANWERPVNDGGRVAGYNRVHFTETMIAARRCVHRALDAVGADFGGLLLDVCCFLKSLAEVERDRQWPARSGKVVLQLALEQLARHYGYANETRGKARAPSRLWLADDVAFTAELSGGADVT